jgi:hypothetical protein
MKHGKKYIDSAKVIDGENVIYAMDANHAVNRASESASENAYVVLTHDSRKITLNKNINIDLNGHFVNGLEVKNDVVANVYDSTTDDYDCSDGYGVINNVTLAEAVAATESAAAKEAGKLNMFVEINNPKLKRYVIIANEDGTVSAHRIYLAINAKTLRPFNNGVGFKAIFAADEVVASQVTYGVELSGMSDFSQVWKASFDEMEAGALTKTPNQKTVVIYDAINVENQSRWDADLYGRPFMTINGQTYYGKTVTVNMKDMAAEALANGDAAVIAAVNEMMTKCGVSAN